MLIFLVTAFALVAAQEIHYDEHYQFGHLHEPIDQIVVFDCGLTKPITRPINGRVEIWRTTWMLGGAASTIQMGCFRLSNTDVIGLDSVGTCDYGDLCRILDLNRPHNPTCTCEAMCFQDWIDLGIPKDQCSCEGIIAPKVYSIPNWNKKIDLTGLDQGLVTWIGAEADYEIKLIAEDANGNEEACIGVWLPIREYAPPNDTGGWLFGRKKRAQARQSL
ncbi:Hypp8822 [Branchiostoma lanceolatum]|uniref:Hypp8822 protein n=1 Tax=Branchiostoma lanceolatum TaxID=7740 RepID=A0A8J9ZAS4_BRALA|nr:Hypp8822 [Branchiostoma lanceolatum]